MAHLLLTNDFPPKVGGIQSYLWELWRRLPPERFTVVTARSSSAASVREFDARQPFRVERMPEPVLLPTPSLARRVRSLAAAAGAGFVLIDPAFPLGLIGPRLGCRYGVVIHGAEIAVPARLPGGGALVRRVLRGAAHLVTGGAYPTAEARRVAGGDVPVTEIPPGVDVDRFHPLSLSERREARTAFGLPEEGRVVLGLSRLVPRKGMDVLIAASTLLAGRHPDLVVAIAGQGRDRARLERLARHAGAPVRFLGPIADDAVPALVGSADVFAMLCRPRWGGLEQEGFGIVFLEAAACGVPQVAGRSGGSAEAVAHGESGFVVRRPDDPAEAAKAIGRLLDDPDLRRRQGDAARRRAEEHFAYDRLAGRLDSALRPLE